MPATKSKPEKPYAGFPLTANGNGQWSKKIDGKVAYLGKWDDPDRALEAFQNHLKGRPKRGGGPSRTCATTFCRSAWT
jgi:hypothetical protein